MSVINLDTVDFAGLWAGIQVTKLTEYQKICDTQSHVKFYTVDEWKTIRRHHERKTELKLTTN